MQPQRFCFLCKITKVANKQTYMGLFSLTQEIAIDLGTANTVITCEGQVVVDEPSVVAISIADNKMVAAA